MNTCLTFIKGELAQKFPKLTDALWVSEFCYQSLIPKGYKGAAYVKITCNEPLKEFTIFCKLEALASGFDDKVFILPSLLSKSEFFDETTPVEINYISIDELKEAQSVTIKVSEELVMTWSEDESEFARQQYKTRNRLVHYAQNVSLQTGTQKSCFAHISKIFPVMQNNEALRVTENTDIILDGLPEHQQKVIDFATIGGLDPIIQTIREIIQVPLTYPHILDAFKVQPPKGLLLHGPPGNGKTMIAKAIAYSLGAKFVSIEGPELNSKYVGVAEQRLREKFEEASGHKNSVLFIDEIDAIARSRDHDSTESHQIDTVATLLNLMDGIRSSKGLFVIGATNRLNSVDNALRRPGRFELEYEIGLPDENARMDILKKNIPLENDSLLDTGVNHDFLYYLAQVTNGYSGADLVSLYRLSVMKAIRRNLCVDDATGRMELDISTESIRLQSHDFLETLREITPTSMRGIDQHRKIVSWNELIISDEIRQKLKEIHILAEKTTASSFTNRPSFMNMVFKGEEGSGKKTIISSFARQYRYELIEFNVMDYLSRSFSQTISDMEYKIGRCKQAAPSIFYVENIEYFPQSEVLFAKLKDSLERTGNKQPILALLAMTKDLEKMPTIGFGQVIEIPNARNGDLQFLSEKYKVNQDDLVSQEGKPMGKVIGKIEELVIQSL